VLWAPAIEFAEAPDVVLTPDTGFGEIDHLVTGPDPLASVDVPVLILHGDEDGLPLENSESIAGALPDAELSVIEGEDHSFLSVAGGARAVDRTLAFLEG